MSTGGHFEYNVGYRHPNTGRIELAFSSSVTGHEAKVRLAKTNKQGGYRAWDFEKQELVWVTCFIVNRFIPVWTEMVEGPASEELRA